MEPSRIVGSRWNIDRKPFRNAGVSRDMPRRRKIWEENKNVLFLKNGENSANLYMQKTVAERRIKKAAAIFRRLPVKNPSSDQGTERMAEMGEIRLPAWTGKTAATRLAAMPLAMPATG
jgi:hypothetical protein